MNKTLIGFFDNENQVTQAMSQLTTLGIPLSQISRNQNPQENPSSVSMADDDATGGRIAHFFDRLLGVGVDENDAGVYAEGVRRGGHVLTVTTTEDQADQVAAILESQGAADINRRSQFFKETGFDRYDSQQPSYNEDQILSERNQYSAWETRFSGSNDTEQVIPVVQEDVKIGKTSRETGRVRVYTRVTETPVNQDITLTQERVDVQRRTVDRPVNTADMEAFREGEINLTETAETATVEKVARVVEEVIVRKDSEQRTEHIHETARRTDVEVERTDSDRNLEFNR